MDASPARLYATLIGGVLVIAGIVGFFYSASFGSPGRGRRRLRAARASTAGTTSSTSLTGALGLLVAGYAARQYALWLGIAYVLLAIWGFALGSGDSILGFIPVNTEDDFLHVILGVLGIAAALATPKTRPAGQSALTGRASA